MYIVAIGLNHKTAPVAVRERVAFCSDRRQEALRRLCRDPEILEGLLLSTCNRVELYACSHDGAAAAVRLRTFLEEFHQLETPVAAEHFYELRDQQAIRHLFRVASSLDSMVLGEPQILGQLKDAFAAAEHCQSVGPVLTRLLHKSFSVAKRVRSETDIACQTLSISYAAVELARKIFGSLEKRRVLLVGAGKMCELAARHLLDQRTEGLLVANRTFERALRLATHFGGRAVPFRDFPDYLPQADIVLTSTTADDYIIRRSQVEKTIRLRRNRPMFFIDIAVPRNIEPAVNQVENVYLFDIDDLQKVIDANLRERCKAAATAEEIIDQEMTSFLRWLGNRELTPTIRDLRRHCEVIRRRELDKTFARRPGLSSEERRALEACTEAMVRKILHRPLTLLKDRRHHASGEPYLDALRTLFGLDDWPEDEESR